MEHLKSILEVKAIEYIAELYELNINEVEELLELEADEVDEDNSNLYHLCNSSFSDYMEGVNGTLSLLNIEFEEDDDNEEED